MHQQEAWQMLAEEICEEADPSKILELAGKLIQLLDEKKEAQKAPYPQPKKRIA